MTPARRCFGVTALAAWCVVATLGVACQPNLDPLARITCSPATVAVGATVSFDSTDSSDPEGKPFRDVSFAFGDGDTASGPAALHAYAAAGAYRAVLSVTDDAGAIDTSSCIVSVGPFPTGTGPLDEIERIPPHYDPTITEDIDKPEHGGLILGFFTASGPASVDEILLDGQPADPALGVVRWCEIVDSNLAAGAVGIVRCYTKDPAFDAGAPASLEVRAGGQSVWTKTANLPAPDLTPSYITSNQAGTEILVHVRNDASGARAVTGLAIDGLDVSRFAVIDNAALAPNGVAVIRVPRPDGVPFGRWLSFTVEGLNGATPVRVTRALRLFPPRFRVGDWTEGSDGNGSSPYADPTILQKYLDRGIDLLLWNPSAAATPEVVLDEIAPQHGLEVFLHQGSPDPAFVAAWRGHPRLAFDAVAGEPEFGETSAETLATVQANRALWGETTPLWSYNACMYHFSEWAPLADVGGMDHYAVWAPKCNTNLPLFLNDLIQYVGSYASEIKRAAEPNPVWDWTQGLYEDDVRCPSADEVRAQWYQVVGRGAKSVLWFLARPSLDSICPASTIDEMARLKQELAPLASLLLEGDVAPANSVARTLTPFIDVTATVGPRGMVLALTDYSYQQLWLTGLVWQPRQGVLIDVTPPASFEPYRFLQVDHDQETELSFQKIDATTYRVTVPAMKVASAIVVEPEP